MTRWNALSRAAALDAILTRAPVLPVLTIHNLDEAVPLARTLVEAGLPVLEVTLRTPVALAAISRIVAQVPGAIVGAGTVLEPAHLDAVAASGAAYAISPGATPALYAAARDAAIPWLPGIATASEVMAGIEQGHQRFKFYPAAAAGGTSALRAWAGPFGDIRFCPTGGIDAESAREYLALANVLTVGGSWMVPQGALSARDWSQIATLARACVAAPDIVSG